MPPLIEIKKITKDYVNGEMVTPVLHGIDLRINEGEFVALMGPSGSGKSTLMHILGFLDHPSGGEYLFRAKNVAKSTSDELAVLRRQEVSFVFQAFHLLPKANILENVMLPLVYQGMSKARRKEAAEKALASVGLSDRLDHLPSQISGGQKQRVAIARALVNNPSVIFADEPTGNLDSHSSGQVMDILTHLHKEGRTIIMVTHEHDIAAYAKRIIRLKDGVIESDSLSL